MPRKTKLNESDMQKEISRSVKSLMDFTKTNTVMNVVESARMGRFNVEESELNKLTNVLELSIEQAFARGYREVEEAVRNLSSKKITSFINYSACKLPELGIIIIPFYFLIMLQNLGMYGYDTFWHGMFSKHINNFGNFWDSESIILQSHMTTLPFFYLFQNFFLTQGEFIERVAVFSNNFFISMGLLAIFSEIKNKFSIRIIAFISVLILYSMFGHGAFMTLTIEHCLSITFAFFKYFFQKNTLIKKF